MPMPMTDFKNRVPMTKKVPMTNADADEKKGSKMPMPMKSALK